MSNKPKLNILDVREEEDNRGQKRDIAKVAIETKRPLCVECKKKERQEASSRCKDCAENYRIHRYNLERLDKKING